MRQSRQAEDLYSIADTLRRAGDRLILAAPVDRMTLSKKGCACLWAQAICDKQRTGRVCYGHIDARAE